VSLRLAADAAAAVARFVDRVAREREARVLVNDQGRGAFVDSNDAPVAVHLLFSARAYARRLAVEEWADWVPMAIPLVTSRMLPALADAGDLVGVDFPADLAGAELQPQELQRRLELAAVPSS
jgi:hypothetical protein